MGYVKPDKVYKVPVTDGELKICPTIDFIHFFPPLGAYILKYFNMESEPPRLCNVPMDEKAAYFLMQQCEVECVFRESMGEEEHDQWVNWQTTELNEADFGLEFSAESENPQGFDNPAE